MDRPAALRARLDTPLAALGLTVLYLMVWLLLLRFSDSLWYLPAGLRLGALWLVPTRRWGWLAAGEWTALAIKALSDDWSVLAPEFLGMSVMP